MIEKVLPPPTKLQLTPFTAIREITPSPAAEIDFIGIVLHSGPLKTASRNRTRCREVIVTDNQLNHFLLTLWDDFADVEGTEIEETLKRGKDNKDAFSGQTISILVGPSGNLAIPPSLRLVIPIVAIPAQNPVVVYYIEAEISIADRRQIFFVLECSGCQ